MPTDPSPAYKCTIILNPPQFGTRQRKAGFVPDNNLPGSEFEPFTQPNYTGDVVGVFIPPGTMVGQAIASADITITDSEIKTKLTTGILPF
jgi:hypothetical protein